MAKKPVNKPVAKPAPAKVIRKTGPAKPDLIEKHGLKIAIAVAVFGLILRLYRIGYLSLWVDEYMHAMAAIKGQFMHGENNGILLTWFNTTFAFIFGHSEFVMRLPVAILGAAVIPATYVLARDLAGKKVGLMSAVFVAISIYMIFWSRVDRPYGMVAAFYVPLLVSFWLMMERKSEKDNFLSRMGINSKYLPFVILAFALSMMSQLICFLFIFSAGFYGTFVAIDNWITKKSKPWKVDFYNILFYLNIVLVVLMLTPIGNNLMRPIIEIFLPGNMATLILPDLKAAMKAVGTDKMMSSFDTYYGVLTADFKLLPFLGFLGFILAFLKNRKMSYFLISTFLVPFLLMSFVFREPCHAKYLSYIYPVFLISAAYSFYHIAFFIASKISAGLNESNRNYRLACTVLFIFICFGVTRRAEIKTMLNTEKHGNIVDKKISEIHFVNWKQPCEFIKENMQKNDIIMATVQMAPRFYLETDSVVWFRQNHYDAKVKDYVPNLPENKPVSAYTYDALVKTYNNNKRGWLLADYYFDNALTDPRAKQFVELNFTYHFDACTDGAVKVFSWDKSKPKPYQNSFVVELGKNGNQQASQPFSITINKAALPPKVNLVFLSQGIDSDTEVFAVFNESKQVAIKTNNNAAVIGQNVVTVDPSYFNEGANKVQFIYNDEEGNGDVIKGCVIFNMEIR